MLLFGGVTTNGVTSGLQNDTWTWDGANWTQLSPVNSPGALINSMMTADTPLAGALIFAGQQDNPGRVVSDTWTFGVTPMPLQLVNAISRKAHGSAGDFDLDLSPDAHHVESRFGGTNGEYTLVFTFTNSLISVGSVMVSSGTGSVASAQINSDDPRQYTVQVSGVADAQTIVVTLGNVVDANGNTLPAVQASLAVLVGDSNGDGFVNSADIGEVKSESGEPVTSVNFREDVNGDGFINSADIGLVKSRSGTALP
jgi:hypothetical protein